MQPGCVEVRLAKRSCTIRLFGSPNIEKLREKRDVDGLVEALGEKDWSVRIDAAKALGEIGDDRALEPLLAFYDQVVSAPVFADVEMIGGGLAAAEEGPGLLGPSATISALLKIAHGSRERLASVLATARESTAGAVVNSADQHTFETIAALVQDDDDRVRRSAIRALVASGDMRAVDALASALPQPDAVAALKNIAHEASSRTPAAVRVLAKHRRR